MGTETAGQQVNEEMTGFSEVDHDRDRLRVDVSDQNRIEQSRARSSTSMPDPLAARGSSVVWVGAARLIETPG
jgi:hypothetical protein